jgi:hypothetical protein
MCIALAEKHGCHVLAEGVYAGAEILSPELDTDTANGVYRAITRAVRLINADKTPYLHHLIAELPADLGTLSPADFHLPRLRYTDPRINASQEVYQNQPFRNRPDRPVDARVRLAAWTATKKGIGAWWSCHAPLQLYGMARIKLVSDDNCSLPG